MTNNSMVHCSNTTLVFTGANHTHVGLHIGGKSHLLHTVGLHMDE